MAAFFHAAVYLPLYNALVYVVGHIPTHDMGIAIIIITILVRLILYPFARRAVLSQMKMKEITPEIEELKKKYKDDQQQQAKAIFDLYKEKGVNPFATLPMLIIQLPILIGLYWVFAFSSFPEIHTDYLYSFIPSPDSVNMHFLGLIDISAKHSIFLAITTAVTQYAYSRLSMGKPNNPDATPVEATLSQDLAKSFDMQARYVLPALMGFISFNLIAAAPLYLTVSNLLMIAQELASGRRYNA